MGKSKNKKCVSRCGKWKKGRKFHFFASPFVAFKSYYKLVRWKSFKLICMFSSIFMDWKFPSHSMDTPLFKLKVENEGKRLENPLKWNIKKDFLLYLHISFLSSWIHCRTWHHIKWRSKRLCERNIWMVEWILEINVLLKIIIQNFPVHDVLKMHEELSKDEIVSKEDN